MPLTGGGHTKGVRVLHTGKARPSHTNRQVVLTAAMVLLVLAVAISPAAAYPSFGWHEPADGNIDSAHFKVLYKLTGDEATTATYAKQVSDSLEAAYAKFVATYGYLKPHDPKIHVYLYWDTPGVGGKTPGRWVSREGEIDINATMGSQHSLDVVAAHELFHVLQSGYYEFEWAPKWVIEGTAVTASYLASRAGAAGGSASVAGDPLASQWSSQFGMFLSGRLDPLFGQEYTSGSFWAYLSQRYGGEQFLHRFFTQAHDLSWTEAAEAAAKAGGAASTTTFDSLYLEFALAAYAGKVDVLNFVSDREAGLTDATINWSGTPVELLSGPAQSFVSRHGNTVQKATPFKVARYGVMGLRLSLDSDNPVTIEVTDTSSSVLPYVLTAGADGKVTGAPLSGGKVTLAGLPRGTKGWLVLARVARTGSGRFKVKATAAAPGAAPTSLVPFDQLITGLPSTLAGGSR